MRSQDLLAKIEDVAYADGRTRLAVYLHVPFCASKCHFCDWVVDVPVARLRSDAAERSPYLDALVAQIRFYGPLLTRIGYRPEVMYWGGGTPTRLGSGELRMVHAALGDALDLSGLRQWTVESTPNDLTSEVVSTLREMGVSRVSLGVQSFDPDQLRRSGRLHTAEDGVLAVARLRAGGIDNFNIDLISSFPGEDATSFSRSLDTALELDPPHVSVYPYRATPRTTMAMQLGRDALAAHGRSAMIAGYEQAMARLTAAGYHEYCHGYWVRRPEDEDHDGNFKYDLTGDKIGFGSGAESIIGQHLLWNQNSRYTEYLARPLEFSSVQRFSLARPEMLTAPIGGALMTREGVVFDRFERLTGLRFADVRAAGYVCRWLEVLVECGAEFVESDTALRLHPATIHRTYVNHLAHSTAVDLAVPRA